MRKYTLLIILLGLVGCSNNRSKDHHKLTVNLCKYEPNKCACNLYVEIYRVFGMGALGSDENSEYLTDSVNYRVYIGTYDEEDEMIITKCKGDSIYTAKTKKTSSKPEWDVPKILESKTYSLKDLKKQHKFE
jgi:hypothetical protein